MDQLEFFDIPSPCIGVCQSGKNGYCLGCFRSREERLYWTKTTPYAKRVIIKACQRRKKSFNAAKNEPLPASSSGQQHSLFSDND